MNRRASLASFAAAFFGCLVSTTWAVVIIDEQFNGTAGSPPDVNSWGVTAAVTLDGAGNAAMDSSGGFQQLVGVFSGPYSQAFVPTAGVDYGHARFEYGGYGAMLWNMSMGVTGYSNKRIWLRSDIGNNLWTVDINDGGAFTYRPTDVPKGAGGIWDFYWYADRVVMAHNGVQKFDSATDLPTAGDAAWDLPNEVLRPDIAGAGGQIMPVDRILWESLAVVPEPSAGLLLAGAVVALRARRRV